MISERRRSTVFPLVDIDSTSGNVSNYGFVDRWGLWDILRHGTRVLLVPMYKFEKVPVR